jgi:hypothetical protein
MRVAAGWTVALWALVGAGCGYVGDPLPPSLHIPEAVSTLSAQQAGGDIVVLLALPALTTDGLKIKDFADVELRIGPARESFERWLEASERIAISESPPAQPGAEIEVTLPSRRWAGQEIAVAARTVGRTGRPSAWSALQALQVRRSLPPPGSVRAELTATGVRLTWPAVPEAGSYRILRQEGEATEEPNLEAPGTDVTQTEWTDQAVAPGATYTYFVQARTTDHAGTWSKPVPVKVEDTFPPPVPTGLTAVPALESIELSWEAVAAPDVSGYRVYRAAREDDWQVIADSVPVPAYSDRSFNPAQSYSYSVTVIDRSGNESDRSKPITVQAP